MIRFVCVLCLLTLIVPVQAQDLTVRVTKLEADVADMKAALSRIEFAVSDPMAPTTATKPKACPCGIPGCDCGCATGGPCTCLDVSGAVWCPSPDCANDPGYYLWKGDQCVGALYPSGKFIRCRKWKYGTPCPCPVALPPRQIHCTEAGCLTGYFGDPEPVAGLWGTAMGGCASGSCGTGASGGGCASGSCGSGGRVFFGRRR